MSVRPDLRLCSLIIAALAALAGLFDPRVPITRQASDLLLVIDITGSMMVRDYPGADMGISRLERAKTAAIHLIGELPCGSRAGLAIFTERQPFLLLTPMETCSNYAPLTGTIAHLDWRMAWEGDSFIARGLSLSIDLADELEADIVFFSDGHEAPPLHRRVSPPRPISLGEREQAPAGLIIGVGNLQPSPIPRFDDDGREAGVWAATIGEEHLSDLRQQYLQSLAATTDLGYLRLEDDRALKQAITEHARQRSVTAQVSLAPWLAGIVLLTITLSCIASLWPRHQRSFISDPDIRGSFSSVKRSTP